PFDMYNFTGGCRYAQSCQNFKNACKKCPALKNIFQNIAEKNFKINSKLINEIKPKIIFPSTYAKQFAKQTNFFNKNIQTSIIEYPVQVKQDSFDNVNNKLIEEIKVKSKNRKIVFLGAQNLKEWRKGIYNFVNLISILKSKYKDLYNNLFFVLVGEGSHAIFKEFRDNSFCIKSLKHDNLVSLYKISDLIIIPSLQEWSSLMMSEVVKLDKFVICFDTGSSKDLITQGKNGYVFGLYDYMDVVEKMNYYFSNPKFFLKETNNKVLNSKITDQDDENLKNKYIDIFND
ncbi:glycosyltransferase, partial [Candidatus Pelagibacter ubique]|nr:glycosyltransferase [Candidatus Pelagibacter ubique]